MDVFNTWSLGVASVACMYLSCISAYLSIFILSQPIHYRAELNHIKEQEEVYGKHYRSFNYTRLQRAKQVFRAAIPLGLLGVVGMITGLMTREYIPQLPNMTASLIFLSIVSIIVAVDIKNRFIASSIHFLSTYKTPNVEDFFFVESDFNTIDISLSTHRVGLGTIVSPATKKRYVYFVGLDGVKEPKPEQLIMVIGCDYPLPDNAGNPIAGRPIPPHVSQYLLTTTHQPLNEIVTIREWSYAFSRELHFKIETRLNKLLPNMVGVPSAAIGRYLYIKRQGASLKYLTPESLEQLTNAALHTLESSDLGGATVLPFTRKISK